MQLISYLHACSSCLLPYFFCYSSSSYFEAIKDTIITKFNLITNIVFFFYGGVYVPIKFFYDLTFDLMKNQSAVKRFSLHLRKLRKQRGFSQQELADTANIAKKTIQRIETGKLNPTLDTLVSLSEAFEIPLKNLVDF